MRVLSRPAVRRFCALHPDARESLEAWYKISRLARWSSFADLRNDYPSADLIGGNRIVFNIKGRKYRLVTGVNFRRKILYVRWFGPHAEYNDIDVADV